MLEANPCPTPMNQSNKLHLQDNEPFEHITLYKSTIGVLQYLTLNFPDIAFSANKLSQFLQSPTQKSLADLLIHFFIIVIFLQILTSNLAFIKLPGIIFQNLTGHFSLKVQI